MNKEKDRRDPRFLRQEMKEVIERIYKDAHGFDKFKVTKHKIIKGCYKAMEQDNKK